MASDRSVITPPEAARQKSLLLACWAIWGGILASLIVVQLVLKHTTPAPVKQLSDIFAQLSGVVPLFVSIVIRWLVIPRVSSLTRALPLFIVGLALAEGAGILGITLGGPYRDHLAILGMLGVAQFMPVFAARLSDKPSGFVPNN